MSEAQTVGQAVNHHHEAERAMAEAANRDYGSDEERYDLACAQVHALLAVAQAVENAITTIAELVNDD